MKRGPAALFFALLALLLIGCSSPAAPLASTSARAPTLSPVAGVPPAPPTLAAVSTPRADYWPTEGWRSASAAEHGVDGEVLAGMDSAIQRDGLALHSILVIRHGYILHETYFGTHSAEEQHELYSVTKSYISTLVGMAHDRGLLPDLDRPVLSFFPGATFDNTGVEKAAMTLEDVLTMRTGLDWDEGNAAYRSLWSSGDWVEYMLDKPMVEPAGRTFNYCSGCSHLLSAIVEDAVGMRTAEFAEQELFAPLGIRNYSWSVDSHGTAIGGWGLRLSARDMAKLGLLYLHGGAWEGRQIISRAWVEAATATHTSTENQLGYGYQWWTHPVYNGYAAVGLGGQTVFVVPRQDLIVVTTADLPGHEPVWQLIDQYVMPALD